jgi:hypothetical protein
MGLFGLFTLLALSRMIVNNLLNALPLRPALTLRRDPFYL